jgi:hypothetical protein
MSAVARARKSQAPPFIDPRGYSRHRPERTLLSPAPGCVPSVPLKTCQAPADIFNSYTDYYF